MISKECFTKEWFDYVSVKLNYFDANLIERVVRAFSLLEMLSQSGCPFIFKGGTSLMILLGDKTKRLSTDIDILCPPGTVIGDYFHSFRAFGFSSVEPIERKRCNDVPKSHCKLHYKVSFRGGTSSEDSSIVLDVLYEESQYAKVVDMPIQSSFIKLEGDPFLVQVPSINDILGDKLTAYAPNTSGVPYEKNGNSLCMQIAKQMYDIARLFDEYDDFGIVSGTFKRIVPIELGYRCHGGDSHIVVKDIIQTSLCLSTRGLAGEGDNRQLINGVIRLRSHIFGRDYPLEVAIVDSAKAACLAAAIESGSSFAHYDESKVDQYAARTIGQSPLSSKLNKLKKYDMEAFFYWSETETMLNSICTE